MPKSPVTSGIHCARHCTKYSNAVDFLFSEDYLLKETPGMRASQATRSYPLPGTSREEKRNFCTYLTLPSHSSPMWMKSLCSCKFPWGRRGQSFWIHFRRGNPITPTALDWRWGRMITYCSALWAGFQHQPKGNQQWQIVLCDKDHAEHWMSILAAHRLLGKS